MKLIPLTKGKFAQVDDEDYEYLMQWKWRYKPNNGEKSTYGYACRTQRDTVAKKNLFVLMHRVIMNTPIGRVTDHIDGDPLNCQKDNMRICTRAENSKNQGKHTTRETSSKYLGVYAHKMTWSINGTNEQRVCYKWRANIGFTDELGVRRRIKSKLFESQEEAAIEFNRLAKIYKGEFARLNILD